MFYKLLQIKNMRFHLSQGDKKVKILEEESGNFTKYILM